MEKINSVEPAPPCITLVKGFESVCLDEDVLQIAYLNYRMQYGHEEKTIHERYRFTAYRQFVMWIFRHLGKKIRVPLPSCVVSKIREKFTSPDYCGFKYPPVND